MSSKVRVYEVARELGVDNRELLNRIASLGIQVSNNASIDITNNVFAVGSAGTGISVTDAASTTIVNNVFYLNQVEVRAVVGVSVGGLTEQRSDR